MTTQGEELKQYYLQKIHELQRQLRRKTKKLKRLEAQSNKLNSRVRMLIKEFAAAPMWVKWLK